jgi:ribosome biogenesis GTPase / thiamine phosphate phosphatase
MLPEELGYHQKLEEYRTDHGLLDLDVGRVVAEHKERYVVMTAGGELEAEITGNLRFTASGREDFPAVGDWVALTVYDDNFALIHHILPRSSVISRQAVGQFGEVQILAANVDAAFLVQAADRDFNLNRLERYLTLCYSAGVKPIAVITKTDLLAPEEVAELLAQLEQRISGVPVIALSNETRDGYEALGRIMEKGKTYCLLGSSGVGKSTLLNNLSVKAVMKSGGISASTGKGRHVTSHREMIILENGSILIDNPGMREVGIADSSGGLETAFDAILRYGQQCRYHDCTHMSEAGCEVKQAVEDGGIDPAAYENYLKMQREKTHFEASVAERRKKDKDFGKIMKNYKKDRNRNEW